MEDDVEFTGNLGTLICGLQQIDADLAGHACADICQRLGLHRQISIRD